MSIKLQLSGFDELFEQIRKAGGEVDRAAEQCIEESAQIMHEELKAQMQRAGVSEALIARMPQPEVEKKIGAFVARVGFKPTAYDAQNPSDYHRAVFLNYGTPHRSKFGQVKARGFIRKAQSKARSQIKKKQQETLERIMGELRS